MGTGRAPMYHLPGNVISRLLALSVLTPCPNMSFVARFVNYNSRSSKNFVGALSTETPQQPLRKYARGFSFCSWLPVRQI